MIEIIFWGIVIFTVLGLALLALGAVITHWKEIITFIVVILVLGVIGKLVFGV